MTSTMVVLLVPVTIALFIAVLVVADLAERRSSLFLVRSSLRSRLSCEETEAIVAAGLAPQVEAAGMTRLSDDAAAGAGADVDQVEDAAMVVDGDAELPSGAVVRGIA